MPERFPAFFRVAAFLFLTGMALSFAIPLAVELGRIAFVKEAMAQ